MVAGELAPRKKSVEIWTNLMSKYSRNMHVLDIGEKAMEDTASPLYNKLLFNNMPHFSKKEAIMTSHLLALPSQETSALPQSHGSNGIPGKLL